jgi:hypothetical protein
MGALSSLLHDWIRLGWSIRPLASEEFEISPLHSLFPLTYTSPLETPYDVSPDAKRIVLNTIPDTIPIPLALVSNWTRDLKK